MSKFSLDKSIRLLSLVAMLLASGLSSVAQRGPIVNIANGRLQGTIKGQVATFQGIPYAAAPTGMLRWRPPQPAANWNGTLDASEPGPDCPQPANSGANSPRGQSENCLTLSVWVPERPPATYLPVLVWVHGGAFTMGGTASLPENGAALARKGIIVVTFNYRLGKLGWFAHPELTAESNHSGTANFGLMDQVAALHWVQQNIASFGGDPHRVTFAGESAGGWTVGLLMTAPSSRGLFDQAIIESGFGREPATPLTDAEQAGLIFARAHDANDLAALRRLPTSAFVQKSVEDVDPKNHIGPILDGVLLPRELESVFAAGQQARMPLIVGSNSFDASLFPQLVAHPEQSVFTTIPGPLKWAVRRVYGNLSPQQLSADLVTDKVFTEPARFLARSQHQLDQPTYRYFFDYASVHNRQTIPGATHAAEVAYAFGNLPESSTAGDRGISSAMMDYWVSFIQRGDPNDASRPLWPKGGEPILVIGREGIAMVPHFEERRLNFVERWLNRSFVRNVVIAAAVSILFTVAAYLWYRRRVPH